MVHICYETKFPSRKYENYFVLIFFLHFKLDDYNIRIRINGIYYDDQITFNQFSVPIFLIALLDAVGLDSFLSRSETLGKYFFYF